MEKTKKQFQSEHTKGQIINAVLYLLASKGYGNTSISDISREAGLTKGALYHHFQNKEEIFYTTMGYLSDVLKTSLIDKEPIPGSALQRLGSLFDTFVKLNENYDQYIMIISGLLIEMGSAGGSFVAPLVNILSELSYYIERIIIKGQTGKEISAELDAKLLSLNIIGMLFGNTIPWLLNKDKINYKALMDVQKEALIRSLQIV